MSIGVEFPYDQCPILQKPKDALDLIAKAWIGCGTLIREATR